MKNHINVPGQFEAEVRIADVTSNNLHLAQTVEILEPTPEIEGIVARQRGNACAYSNQLLDQPRADKPVTAGHQNALALKFHIALPRRHRKNSWAGGLPTSP